VKVDVLRVDGSSSGRQAELPAQIFEIEPNDHAIYLAVKAQMTNKRRGTASVKNRALVAGGGRKPWRQKGRGVARAGTIRSPIWRGGGTVFGPTPHPYHLKVNKKVKRLARKSVLSYKAQEGNIVVVEDFDIESGKTRDMAAILQQLDLDSKKITLLVPQSKAKLLQAGRNIPTLQICEAKSASIYELLNCEKLVIQETAIEKLQEVF